MALDRFRLGFGGGRGGATNTPIIYPLTYELPAGSTFTRASGVWTLDYQGILKNAGNNVPAFTGARLVDASTWSALDTEGAAIADATLLGYLSEPAATNLALRSQEDDNAYWTPYQVTPAANSIAAPDGTVTAEKITEVAANDQHIIYRAFTAALNSPYTAYKYFKAGTRSKVWLAFSTANLVNGGYAIFNLSGAGSVVNTFTTGTGTNVSASIKALANGWYRCSVTAQLNGADTAAYYRHGLVNDADAITYLGDASKYVYVWQADAVNAPFATSPIPTTSGTASRAGTIANIPLSKVTAAKGAVEITVTPLAAGQTGVIWSSHVDADNYTDVSATPTTVTLNKRVSGTTYTATASYTHQAGVAFTIKPAWDDVTGLFVKADSGTAGTHANTTNAQLKGDNTCQVGTRNGGSYFVGNFKNLTFYARKPSSWS